MQKRAPIACLFVTGGKAPSTVLVKSLVIGSSEISHSLFLRLTFIDFRCGSCAVDMRCVLAIRVSLCTGCRYLQSTCAWQFWHNVWSYESLAVEVARIIDSYFVELKRCCYNEITFQLSDQFVRLE
ncbi:unnamed protein product [Enterobius vermicularis]|uniref:Secreted protein n=1 Tax=Enterobius vermicularis TaxID=51028 RepID=A0A0N4UWE0_ENTVE|nr:unnamed protein product [Enterobius vermicularis]